VERGWRSAANPLGHFPFGYSDAPFFRRSVTRLSRSAWSSVQGRNNGFGRDDFHIDFDRRQVTCPQGETSAGWHGPYPASSPTAAPLIVARFTKSQRRPCPVCTRCTTTTESARSVGFPARELRDLQLRVRAE